MTKLKTPEAELRDTIGRDRLDAIRLIRSETGAMPAMTMVEQEAFRLHAKRLAIRAMQVRIRSMEAEADELAVEIKDLLSGQDVPKLMTSAPGKDKIGSSGVKSASTGHIASRAAEAIGDIDIQEIDHE